MLEARRAAAAAAMLIACAMPAWAADAPPGASSCSGCHPAAKGIDTPVARLVGRNAADIVAAVRAYRSGERKAVVMDRVAKGFTDDEIKAIADWYAAQKD